MGWDLRTRRDSACIDTGVMGPDTQLDDHRNIVRPQDGAINGSSLFDRGAYEIRSPATRVRGEVPNRYSQALGVMLDEYRHYNPIDDVVIACGDDYAMADPLAAAGVCWAYDAPLLLTRSTTLTADTDFAFSLLALRTSSAKLKVHIVGGTGSVPRARLNDSASIIGTEAVSFDRIIAAGDRYDLAAAIAQRLHDVRHADFGDVALLANCAEAVKFFDALALSPIARAKGCPVLLVEYGSVPTATKNKMSALGLTKRFVAGGPATVSEAVRASLGATRWWGADRYSTAVAVANGAKAKGWLNFATVGLANGKTGLYDALTGGTMVGREGGVLLLTPPWALAVSTKHALIDNRSGNAESYIFANYTTLPSSITTEVGNILT